MSEGVRERVSECAVIVRAYVCVCVCVRVCVCEVAVVVAVVLTKQFLTETILEE